MPIDLTAVDWAYIGILSLICFIAALLGSLISFRNKVGGAIIAAILFAAGFVAWTYYPHPQLPGPLAPRTAGDTTHAAAAPAPAPSPMRPANPVETVSPPAAPAPAPAAPANPAPSGAK